MLVKVEYAAQVSDADSRMDVTCLCNLRRLVFAIISCTSFAASPHRHHCQLVSAPPPCFIRRLLPLNRAEAALPGRELLADA